MTPEHMSLIWPVVIAFLLLWIRHLDRRVAKLEIASMAASKGFAATIVALEAVTTWVEQVSDRLDNEPCHREVK